MGYHQALSKYRTAMMGIAAWLIVWYHCFLDTPISMINYVVGEKGAFGVDIFVFLSGFGIAHLLRKKESYVDYMRFRAGKILPQNYAALILCAVFMLIYEREALTIEWFSVNIVPFSALLGADTEYWYVCAALGYYAIAPFIVRMMDNSRYKRLSVILIVLFFSTFVIIPSQSAKYELLTPRIPGFIIGLAAGHFSINHGDDKKELFKDFLMIAGFFIVGMALAFSRSWLYEKPFMIMQSKYYRRLIVNLVTPLLTVLLAYILLLIDKTFLKIIKKALEFSGKYSLEIYLSHIALSKIIVNGYDMHNMTGMIILVLFTLPAALLIRLMGKGIIKSVHFLTSDSKNV